MSKQILTCFDLFLNNFYRTLASIDIILTKNVLLNGPNLCLIFTIISTKNVLLDGPNLSHF